VSAYVIAEIEVTNPDGYAEYAPLANASVLRHGGRFVVRGGPSEVIEGDWAGRIVVLEFESLDAARAWYDSEDYQACLPLRLQNSKGRMIAVEGATAGS
jgi:uncharacterized protein (DUF1330 family)